MHTEIEGVASALRKYGAGAVKVEEYGADLVDSPTIVLRVEATRPSRLGLGGFDRADTKKQGRKSRSRRRRDR